MLVSVTTFIHSTGGWPGELCMRLLASGIIGAFHLTFDPSTLEELLGTVTSIGDNSPCWQLT